MSHKKYDLVGIDGNAFSIMGYVERAMRREGIGKEARDSYLEDAMSDDYDHLLMVSMEMIERLNDSSEE